MKISQATPMTERKVHRLTFDARLDSNPKEPAPFVGA